MPNVLLVQNARHVLVLPTANVVFAYAEDNFQVIKLWISRPRQEIHRIVEINRIVVVAVYLRFDIKGAAHREQCAHTLRIAKSEVSRVVTAKTASSYDDPVVPRLLPCPLQYVLMNKLVV